MYGMYSPCGLFVRMASGIIWPLLGRLTFLRQKETFCLLAQVVLEPQVPTGICIWTCHTASATSCSASVPYGLVDDERQADERNSPSSSVIAAFRSNNASSLKPQAKAAKAVAYINT